MNENQHQRLVVNYVRAIESECSGKIRNGAARLRFTHPANGAQFKNGARTCSNLKALGLMKGTPDLVFFAARQGYHGLFIEMKTLTGKPSRDQLDFLDDVARGHFAGIVCYGYLHAIKAFNTYFEIGSEDLLNASPTLRELHAESEGAGVPAVEWH